MWIPAHRGIVGNEVVDEVAKYTARTPFKVKFGLPTSDIKRVFEERYKNEVRTQWPFYGNPPVVGII